MAIRPKTTKIIGKVAEPEEQVPALEQFGQRKRPDVGQYRLQVDRQTKSTYTTLEEAEQAGSAIKQAHPIVQIAVYDSKEGINTIIELKE
jgi:hypothetical protein